jgi:putative ABC transport system permease protein
VIDRLLHDLRYAARAFLRFGTSPTDALTFAAVAALLVAIAAGASLVPAVRASQVDPLIALRDE